jgi:hypothetical protein
MMFKNWEWEDSWRLLGYVVVASVFIVALTLGIALSVQPHNVDYYYVSHASNPGPGICVYAHWTWHTDEAAYCGDSAAALDFAAKANAMLRNK